jgi:hypothetical protein
VTYVAAGCSPGNCDFTLVVESFFAGERRKSSRVKGRSAQVLLTLLGPSPSFALSTCLPVISQAVTGAALAQRLLIRLVQIRDLSGSVTSLPLPWPPFSSLGTSCSR